MTTVALLGLGEAGRTFAAALAGHVRVVGWDPFMTTAIDDVVLAASAQDAVEGAEAVLAFTTAAHSIEALEAVVAVLPTGTVYADFATAGPALKRRLADIAAAASVSFVDVAIMSPVRRGVEAVPLLLSGDGTASLGALLSDSGLRAELLDGPAGTAAARKLLRSMLIKGVTGVLIESLRAAEAEGLLEWFSSHAALSLTTFDPAMIAGLLEGTRAHSVRRVDEVLAAAEMAEAAGQGAGITRAVAALLRTVPAEGIPAGEALHV